MPRAPNKSNSELTNELPVRDERDKAPAVLVELKERSTTGDGRKGNKGGGSRQASRARARAKGLKGAQARPRAGSSLPTQNILDTCTHRSADSTRETVRNEEDPA